MERKYLIYKTTNKINGKIYIGQTHYENPGYLGSGVLITNAINKYGKENFIKEYIDEAQTQDKLDELEKFWINKLKAQDRDVGYNIADGGWNDFTMNDDIKKKISLTLSGKYVGDNSFRKGLKLTDEHKNAISKANKGKKLSDDTKKKISESRMGMIFSDETRKKLSDAHTGKKLSESHKRAISDGLKGRIVTDETRTKLKSANINNRQKHSIPVIAICNNTGERISFNNLSAASRHFKCARQTIKGNKIKDWDFKFELPLMNIKEIRNESKGDR